MARTRQNFMGGAAILAGAVAVTKLLGAVYKIPLGNLLDSEGMAHFYAAYNIYSLLLVLSTAGLPLALSRLVSSTSWRASWDRPACSMPCFRAATMAAADRWASFPPRSTQADPAFNARAAASEVTLGRLS